MPREPRVGACGTACESWVNCAEALKPMGASSTANNPFRRRWSDPLGRRPGHVFHFGGVTVPHIEAILENQLDINPGYMTNVNHTNWITWSCRFFELVASQYFQSAFRTFRFTIDCIAARVQGVILPCLWRNETAKLIVAVDGLVHKPCVNCSDHFCLALWGTTIYGKLYLRAVGLSTKQMVLRNV